MYGYQYLSRYHFCRPHLWKWILAHMVLFSFLISSPTSGQSIERIFSSANEAYFKGDFDSAIKQYEKLVQAGIRDPDVYFNLATAYARKGKYGKAILYFERCLKADPGDETAEAGLAACRTILGKRQAESKGEATVQTKPPLSTALLRPFSENLLAWLLLVFNIAFFSIIIAYRFIKIESVRIGLGIAAPLLVILLLLSGASLVEKSEMLKEGQTAVITQNSSIREGPDPRASIRAQAQEGQSARILDQEEKFVKVRLGNGQEGWMNRSDIEKI